MMQTSARIAGVIGEEFARYTVYLIPPLIARIATEINIEVNEGNLPQKQASEEDESKGNHTCMRVRINVCI
jgi:hypothetical protein